jgi:hypothetical protein
VLLDGSGRVRRVLPAALTATTRSCPRGRWLVDASEWSGRGEARTVVGRRGWEANPGRLQGGGRLLGPRCAPGRGGAGRRSHQVASRRVAHGRPQGAPVPGRGTPDHFFLVDTATGAVRRIGDPVIQLIGWLAHDRPAMRTRQDLVILDTALRVRQRVRGFKAVSSIVAGSQILFVEAGRCRRSRVAPGRRAAWAGSHVARR